MKCSMCGETGHNCRKCPNDPSNPRLPKGIWRDWVDLTCETLDYDPVNVYKMLSKKVKLVRVEHIGAPCVKNSKSLWSRPYNGITDDDWVVPDHLLVKIEKFASVSDDRPKEFLKLLYLTSEYQREFSSKKRGANAKNWKEDGKYICPSLHKADNIYQMLGKRVWCDDMKTKGTKFADTWINEPSPQCQVVTGYSGKQCRRSGDCLCTQHRKQVI